MSEPASGRETSESPRKKMSRPLMVTRAKALCVVQAAFGRAQNRRSIRPDADSKNRKTCMYRSSFRAFRAALSNANRSLNVRFQLALRLSGGGRIRTDDLEVMSLASYLAAPPRVRVVILSTTSNRGKRSRLGPTIG